MKSEETQNAKGKNGERKRDFLPEIIKFWNRLTKAISCSDKRD